MGKGKTSNDFYFLKGGGEMGELIRATNWSKTPLGDPKDWPSSLRTTVAIMLDNPFGMYIAWGKEYTQLYNDGYRPILGSTKHPQALGISTRETFSEIWHIIGSMFDGVRNGKAVGFPDFMLPLNRNGFVEECYFDFSYSPIRLDGGEVGGVLVTVIETTNKKKAESALKESEGRFKTMAEDSDILIATSDKTSNATYFNKAWSILTGRSVDELLNFGWADLIHIEDRQRFLDIYLSAFEKRENWKGEFRIRCGDDSYRWLLAKGVALFHEDKSFSGYISSSVDISDQLAAVKKLEQSIGDLRSMVLNAPIGICVMEAPSLISEIVNDSFIEVAGKPYEAIAGKHYWDTFAEAKPYYEGALRQVVEKGITFYANEVELMLIRHGKEERIYVTFVYAPLKDKAGTVKKVAVWVLENTQQVKARQEIQEIVAERTKELADSNSSLQRSNAELAQFAYIASHDLQEPLRKISTFAQMLENRIGTQFDDQSRSYMNKINSSSSRMNKLIRDVLTYSELVNENEVFAEVDLNQIIENSKSDYDLLIEQKEAVIQSSGLPVLEAIPLQMAQLFGNMIGNALKFTRKDVKPVIRISSSEVKGEDVGYASLEKNRKYYHIRFVDNGIGMKAEYTEQIFNIFQRLHRKSEYEGTGIGLAMCKKIALNHHGDINAKGSTEDGAVFNIFLPARQ